MFRVQLFSGEAGARKLAPAWRSLTAQLRLKRHFHHVEWYLALARTFEQHNQAPLQFLAVFQGDAAAAIFPYQPLHLKIQDIPLRVMQLVSDATDSLTARDFIAAPSLAESDFLMGFVQFVAQNDPHWDAISLPGLLEDSIAARAIRSSPHLTVLETPGTVWGRVEFITCRNDANPLTRLSKGFRQNLRTSHNKLTSTDVTFECARTETDLAALLPDFLKVESSGWKGELGTSALKQPPMNTFLHQLISEFGPSGRCEIHLMRVSGHPIAALFGIVTDNIWYIFRMGYDEMYHRASPGHLLIENLFRRRATDRSFDVLTPYNAPPWFGAWKPDVAQRIVNIRIFRPSPEGTKLAKEVGVKMLGAA